MTAGAVGDGEAQAAAPSLATVRDLFVQHRADGCNDKCHLEDITEWWCPARGRWTDCHGPCPSGEPHAQQRRSSALFHHIPELFAAPGDTEKGERR